MIAPRPPRAAPSAADRKSRRREIEGVLAGHGLIPGPRRLGLATEAPEDRVARARRLAGALAGLGPVFAGFGRYLATRADVLLPAECRELAAIPDRAPAAPATAIARRLDEELGGPPEELFAAFDPAPVRSSLFTQTHRAVLAGGRRVEVRVVRSGAIRAAVRDLPLLTSIGRAWPPGELPIDELVAGFRADLEQRLDLAAEASSLAAIAAETADAELVAVVGTHPHLSSPGVLTTDRDPGIPLAAWTGPPAARAELRRALCRLWLEQVTVRGRVPVAIEVRASDERVLRLVGGRFAGCPTAVRAGLTAYLRAAAAGDSDGAYRRLSAELVADRDADPVELRRRFRQAMPLREIPLEERGDRLADQLVVHWRLIRECGYRPRPELDAFYRGLFRLLETLRQLGEADGAPDALREAVEDLEWVAGWAELGRFAELPRLLESLEGHLGAAAAWPATMDRALRRSLEDELPPPPPPSRGRSHGWEAAAGLALAAFAVALAAGELAAVSGDGWIEGAGAVVVLALGAGVLRVLWRVG